MVKLVALFKKPADPETFESRLTGKYLPLVRNLPGLRSLTVTRLTASPLDEDRFALMAELLFESRETLDAAMASREGKAANRELLGFAGGRVTILTGVVEE
jgi:uncharacterized protein (TIGR02118 family)